LFLDKKILICEPALYPLLLPFIKRENKKYSCTITFVQKRMKYVFLLLLTITNVYSKAQISEPVTSPKPTGEWGVGRRLEEWVDSSRVDPLDSTQPRVLPIWIWYPTLEKGVKPQPALSVNWRAEQAKYLNKKVGAKASSFLTNLNVWAQPNAPVAVTGQQFPVLLFGPGHTWLPTDYSTIIEELVSHGYIVVGYAPTGFPGVTQLSNGKIVEGKLNVDKQDITFADAQFVRKQLNRLEGQWLKGVIDTRTIGMLGHSQGGIAATYLAGYDTTITAFVNLDGDLMGSALKVKTVQPALLLSNDERIGIQAATNPMELGGRERSEYRRHADWVRATDNSAVSLRIRLTGIRHLNFNDLALVPAADMTATERKDKLGPMDGVKALTTITTLTRQFLDAHFKKQKFLNMVKLEQTYPETRALLWKGVPFHEQ